MPVNQRHQNLLTLLRPNEARGVAELAQSLEASEATIRRDLVALSQSGKVIRTHGGVLLKSEVIQEAGFVEKSGTAVEAKRRIGRAAGRAVPSGACVFVDAGTTCLEAARALIGRGDVRLVTNSIPVLVEACRGNVPVTSVGGEVRGITRALVGGTTLEWFNDWRFDVALIGASGLDAEAGVFTTEPLEASVKIAVMKRAREPWLLADASKWQHPAAKRFARWSVFSRWFVDATRQLQPPRHSNFPCIETV